MVAAFCCWLRLMLALLLLLLSCNLVHETPLHHGHVCALASFCMYEQCILLVGWQATPLWPQSCASTPAVITCTAPSAIRDHGTITYEPELEEVSKGVRGVIDDMLNSTTTIKGVGDKLLPLLPLGDCFLPSVTHEDEEVQVAIAAVDQILQENMVGPRDLAEMYHEFQYLLDMTIEEHVEMITASDPRPSLEDFDKELSQLYSDIEKIRSTTLNEVAFKLLKVDSCVPVASCSQHSAYAHAHTLRILHRHFCRFLDTLQRAHSALCTLCTAHFGTCVGGKQTGPPGGFSSNSRAAVGENLWSIV